MFKSCTRCGKIHDVKHKCKVKIERKYNYGEAHKLRITTAWLNKSKEIKTRAGFLCEVCKDDGAYNYKCLETHHIEKLKDNPAKMLDDDNLIVLCSFHHKMADRGMLDPEYLRKLANIRDKGFVKKLIT